MALNALQRKGENAIKRSSRSYYGLAAFLLLLGTVFLVNFPTDDGGLRTFDILITAVFWASAVFFFVIARKAGADSR